MFVNFALNKDPHLRAALMTAMRQVARLDYVAIAQHFNGQFADEDPPIMTSAGVCAGVHGQGRSQYVHVHVSGPQRVGFDEHQQEQEHGRPIRRRGRGGGASGTTS